MLVFALHLHATPMLWYAGLAQTGFMCYIGASTQSHQIISKWMSPNEKKVIKSILKKENQGQSRKVKCVQFAPSPDKRVKLLGYAYPKEEYDRTSTIPDEPKSIVDMMTYVVASLPSDTDEELDDYQRNFFLKMVLKVFSMKTFGSQKWAEENEPFFSDTVDTYLQFDEELRIASIQKVRKALRVARAQMPNVRMEKIMALDAHLNRVMGTGERGIGRAASWSDDVKVPQAAMTAVDTSARP